MRGQIVKNSSDLYFISYEDKIYPCKCRGIFRKEHITPVVGDYVLFNKDKLLVEKILDRKNYFERPRVSNIDQAFLVTSLKEPDLSLNLLDKFLSLMELNHVKPIICITKKDLVSNEEWDSIKDIFMYYKKIGYEVVFNTEIDKIKELLKNKISVFTGQTGAGKSSLLNKLNPNWNLEVGEISKALGRGKHTTRIVELFTIFGGKVMDTPGFSSLFVPKMEPVDLYTLFPEFIEPASNCKFTGCAHDKEPKCGVKDAVSNGEIAASRYENYLQIYGEMVNERNNKYR